MFVLPFLFPSFLHTVRNIVCPGRPLQCCNVKWIMQIYSTHPVERAHTDRVGWVNWWIFWPKGVDDPRWTTARTGWKASHQNRAEAAQAGSCKLGRWTRLWIIHSGPFETKRKNNLPASISVPALTRWAMQLEAVDVNFELEPNFVMLTVSHWQVLFPGFLVSCWYIFGAGSFPMACCVLSLIYAYF